MEDLVRHYGMREGVVSIGSGSGSSTPTLRGSSMSVAAGKRRAGAAPLPFEMLSIAFSPRTVGLVLNSAGRKRTIVTVARTREEKLEYAAKRLVRELGVWLAGSRR